MKMAERIRVARNKVRTASGRPMTQLHLAEALGLTQPTVSEWESGKTHPGRDRIDALARVLNVDAAWLELGKGRAPGGDDPAASRAEVSSVDASRVVPLQPMDDDLPVYGTAQGGPDGMLLNYDAIEFVPRAGPLKGVPGAFAMYVVGDSMSPRYDEGELLMIHPRKPPRRGDDVLIIRRDEYGDAHAALVKRFVRRDGETLVLEQFNPPLEIRVAVTDVHDMHLVVGRFHRG